VVVIYRRLLTRLVVAVFYSNQFCRTLLPLQVDNPPKPVHASATTANTRSISEKSQSAPDFAPLGPCGFPKSFATKGLTPTGSSRVGSLASPVPYGRGSPFFVVRFFSLFAFFCYSPFSLFVIAHRACLRRHSAGLLRWARRP